MTVYALIVKSPWSDGRIGPPSKQDWFRQCQKAVKLATSPGDRVIACSANRLPGTSTLETTSYQHVVRALEGSVEAYEEGTETVSHVLASQTQARALDAPLVLIVTWTHFLRAWFIVWRYNIQARIEVAWGLPRPREVFTDAGLTFLHPIMYWCGREAKLLEYVQGRRKAGTF